LGNHFEDQVIDNAHIKPGAITLDRVAFSYHVEESHNFTISVKHFLSPEVIRNGDISKDKIANRAIDEVKLNVACFLTICVTLNCHCWPFCSLVVANITKFPFEMMIG
jgi:hypothetical protein